MAPALGASFSHTWTGHRAASRPPEQSGPRRGDSLGFALSLLEVGTKTG